VILDIPGQEQLAETVFEVLTEEQKAELLGRAAASERGISFKKFEVNEAAFEKWTPYQMAGFVRALNRDAQEELAASMRFKAKDFDAMRAEMVAEKFSGLDLAARQNAFRRFEANEAAFQKWTDLQRGYFARLLNRDAQAELAAAMRIDAADLATMRAEAVAEKFSGLDLEARANAFRRFEANETAFEKWTDLQKAYFARLLNRDAQAELAASMRFHAKDFDAMRGEFLAQKFSGVDLEARANAFRRFEANEVAFQKWTPYQMAGFVRALNRDAQAELAASMRFKAKDFDAMRAEMVAEKFSGLDLAARQNAFRRFEANEAAFEKWTDLQRAGYSDLLGAKGLEHALLQRGTFNRLTQAQQRLVWSRLGSDGQFAALRYAGLEADLARGDFLERGEQFERVMAERFAN
jgi:stress-induced morphogen